MSFIHEIDALVEESGDPLLAAADTWARVRLGEVARVTNGFAFASAKFSRGRGKPLIRIRDIGSANTTAYFDGPYDAAYLVKTGDLLVGMDGEFKVGRWAGPEALLNQRVCRISTDERLYLSRFLELVLPGYLAAIHTNTSSQTVKHLSSRTITEIPLPLPPLAEQKRIVEKVEALLAQVQAARDRLERVQQILKRFRQAVLTAACEGTLTEEWRVDHERSEWRLSPLREFGLEFQTGPFGSQLHREDYLVGGVPLVNPMHLRDGVIVPTPEAAVAPRKVDELARFKLRRGDVVLARRGELGRAAVVQEGQAGFICGTGSMVLRPSDDSVVPEFLAAFLSSPSTRAALEASSVGSTMSNLNQGTVGALGFPAVSRTEQLEVLRRVNQLSNHASAVERHARSTLERVNGLPRAILAKAFAGDLVPTEAELARAVGRGFESGDELLARVRASRAPAAAAKAAGRGRKARKGA